MKSKHLVILLVLLSLSCNTDKNRQRQRPRFVCSCEQNEKVQSFLEKSIEPVNNKSDEEMEDVINMKMLGLVQAFFLNIIF